MIVFLQVADCRSFFASWLWTKWVKTGKFSFSLWLYRLNKRLKIKHWNCVNSLVYETWDVKTKTLFCRTLKTMRGNEGLSLTFMPTLNTSSLEQDISGEFKLQDNFFSFCFQSEPVLYWISWFEDLFSFYGVKNPLYKGRGRLFKQFNFRNVTYFDKLLPTPAL